jgi:hypothetical protein
MLGFQYDSNNTSWVLVEILLSNLFGQIHLEIRVRFIHRNKGSIHLVKCTPNGNIYKLLHGYYHIEKICN